MLKILLIDLIVLLVYMSAWYLFGRRRRRLDVVDTAWGGGFVLVAVISLISRQNTRTELIGSLVLLWGLRLAVHIWQRNGRKGPDPRYVELSAKWNQQHFWRRAYLSIFLTQGLLILIVSLPISVAGSETTPLKVGLAVLGTTLWLFGFALEAVADRQLNKFVSSDNKGKVLRTGLWRYSRHPNYFGELLQWWSIALIALGPAIGWLGLLGPLTLSWLIIFISGIPSIEKRRLKNPEYQAYKRQTSPLVPLPPRQ